MSKHYPGSAVFNGALEEAALEAIEEANRLQALAAEIRAQMARAPRRGQKSKLLEYLAGVKAALTIALAIRKLKISEEEG